MNNPSLAFQFLTGRTPADRPGAAPAAPPRARWRWPRRLLRAAAPAADGDVRRR